MKQKILLIDDDPYVHKGVAALLEPHYQITHAYSIIEVEKLLKNHRFDLAILDLDLKREGYGIDLIPQLQAVDCKVLILTTMFDHESILGCLRAKVNGFAQKQDRTLNLLETVRGVLAGNYMVDPALIAEITREENRLPTFGVREEELMALLFTNSTATSEELAEVMHVTPGRINNMLGTLYRKTGVHKRPQLLAELKRRGYRPKVPEKITQHDTEK